MAVEDLEYNVEYTITVSVDSDPTIKDEAKYVPGYEIFIELDEEDCSCDEYHILKFTDEKRCQNVTENPNITIVWTEDEPPKLKCTLEYTMEHPFDMNPHDFKWHLITSNS
mmetsp:Transcript_28440/g.25288  ORF Transcript_28440/g.25288 Transcript_28440/m.25288 type:complete len:111 (-) Transcript_28440:69-401(-)